MCISISSESYEKARPIEPLKRVLQHVLAPDSGIGVTTPYKRLKEDTTHVFSSCIFPFFTRKLHAGNL